MMVRRSLTLMFSGFVLASTVVLVAQNMALRPVDPTVVAVSANKLDEYAGQYRAAAEPDVVDSVYREGGSLFVEGERWPRTELKAESADHFFVSGSSLRVEFVRDAAGKVSGLKMSFGAGGERQLVRFSDDGVRLNHFREYTKYGGDDSDARWGEAACGDPAAGGVGECGEALPFLMKRTPYGADDNSSNSVNVSKPELAASGYIFVYGDIRGRYGSEGKFVMNRPIVAHKTKNDVDETTDTRDTIDWLLKNVPNNNGSVGVCGVSYPGFLAMMAGIDAHPAVKAISPQAPMTNIWMGDDFFHNGAFRETYGFDYVQQLEAQKTDVPVECEGRHVRLLSAERELCRSGERCADE